MFNRAKQFTEERLGKAERTENDPAFENLCQRTDKIKGYTEKLVKNSEAVLVPNPGKALHTAPKMDLTNWLFIFSGQIGDVHV